MFAATKGAGAPQLKVQTFFSSTTWVAPGGTTKIISMSGRGSAATSDTYYPSLSVASAGVNLTGGPNTNPPYADWGSLYARITGATSTISANSGVNKCNFYPLFYYVGPDNTWSSVDLSYEYWISGNSFTVSTFGSPQTSGNVLYSQGSASWNVTTAGYLLGTDGVASSAFGYNFPGGTLSGTEPYRTGSSAPITSYDNIPVTPGTSYGIFVGGGGGSFVTIRYIG